MGMKKLCVAALVAIAMGAGTVAPASAAEEIQIVEIRNVALGLCLENTAENRYLPAVTTCTGSTAQQFERLPAAAGGDFFRSLASDYCLDRWDYSGYLWGMPCNSENAGQRAEVMPSGADTHKLRYQGKFAQATYPQAGVEFADENASDGQQWRIRVVGTRPKPEPAAVFKLRSAADGTCVTERDTGLALADCAAAPRFERLDLGAGAFGMRSTSSGRCLANPSGSAVTTALCSTDDPAQRWTLTSDEFGLFKVARSTRHLTPSHEGTTVAAYEYWSIGVSQKWELVAG